MYYRNLVCTVEHKTYGEMKFDIRSFNSTAYGKLYIFGSDGEVTEFNMLDIDSFKVTEWKSDE